MTEALPGYPRIPSRTAQGRGALLALSHGRPAEGARLPALGAARSPAPLQGPYPYLPQGHSSSPSSPAPGRGREREREASDSDTSARVRPMEPEWDGCEAKDAITTGTGDEGRRGRARVPSRPRRRATFGAREGDGCASTFRSPGWDGGAGPPPPARTRAPDLAGHPRTGGPRGAGWRERGAQA